MKNYPIPIPAYPPKPPQMKKPPEGGFGVSWWPGAESTRSNKFFRDLIGQSGLWPAQHDSNVRPTP